MSRTVIVLAAGEGKRMKSDLPKVLHSMLGRSLVGHVLAAVEPLAAERTIVVVGHGREQVTEHLTVIAQAAEVVVQAEQHGTGHAVRIALPAEVTGTVVVLAGDAPLLRSETVAVLLATHEAAGAAATVLSARVPDPTGFGRIVRDADGGLSAIVEQRDASPEVQEIKEINSGVYAFDAALLRAALGKLTSDNQQGEEYLTDVIGLLRGSGEGVGVLVADDGTEVLGCNDRVQLAQLGAILRDRTNERLMRDGVTIIDPATTWIDVTVECERDAIIEPSTQLRGSTRIATGAVIGPEVTLIDTIVGEDAKVVRAHAVEAVIGPKASVGPYAYLRPGAQLGVKSKVGTFVEIKNSTLGEGTKVPHLSYVGDATIGEHTNIGAANVFANYSGSVKSRTVVGSHVKTGSDTTLVAPVTVGDGAYTGAGAVIRRDVPAGALAFTAAMQRNIDRWVLEKRPGTPAAEAAERALDQG